MWRASAQPFLQLPGGVGEWAPAGQEEPVGPLSAPAGFVEYRNEEYGFSLWYPQELTVQERAEGGGATTMVFERVDGGGGFQIYALPYAEAQVSERRFRMDVPSGVMEEPMEVVIDGVRANAFFSKHVLLGETREVWFLRGGYLFEVTTYRQLDAWLAGVMATWRFL